MGFSKDNLPDDERYKWIMCDEAGSTGSAMEDAAQAAITLCKQFPNETPSVLNYGHPDPDASDDDEFFVLIMMDDLDPDTVDALFVKEYGDKYGTPGSMTESGDYEYPGENED
jgi:hypothetical protein